MEKMQIINELQQLPLDIELAYLFGSYANGRQTEDSDIDIAILPAKPINAKTLWLLAQQLSQSFDKQVDLIDLMRCDTVLRRQVIDEGVLLFDPKNKAGFFEITTYRMYQDLQLERRDNLLEFERRWLNPKGK